MTAKGYCTVTPTGQVSPWYGAELTTAQADQAAAWLEEAEQLIDAATARAWLTGPLLNEWHLADGPLVFCDAKPVTSVEAVRAVPLGEGPPSAVEYRVEDLPRGRVRVLVPWGYAAWLLDYTPVAIIPTVVSEATAALLATWLGSGGVTAAAGAILEKQVGDVTVRYADPGAGAAAGAADTLPPRVRQLLAPYLPVAVYA